MADCTRWKTLDERLTSQETRITEINDLIKQNGEVVNQRMEKFEDILKDMKQLILLKQ